MLFKVKTAREAEKVQNRWAVNYFMLQTENKWRLYGPNAGLQEHDRVQQYLILETEAILCCCTLLPSLGSLRQKVVLYQLTSVRGKLFKSVSSKLRVASGTAY